VVNPPGFGCDEAGIGAQREHGRATVRAAGILKLQVGDQGDGVLMCGKPEFWQHYRPNLDHSDLFIGHFDHEVR
jgi:hypothetical protein